MGQACRPKPVLKPGDNGYTATKGVRFNPTLLSSARHTQQASAQANYRQACLLVQKQKTDLIYGRYPVLSAHREPAASQPHLDYYTSPL